MPFRGTWLFSADAVFGSLGISSSFSTPFGMKINGDISPYLTQDEVAQYNRDFSNEACMVTLMKFTTVYNNGNERITYELVKIQPV